MPESADFLVARFKQSERKEDSMRHQTKEWSDYVRTKIILGGIVLVSGLATSALGQFDPPLRAAVFLGDTVKGPEEQELGSVKDLALDLANGRVVEVIIARGGFWGMGIKDVGVPPDDFLVVNEGKTLRLNLTEDRLDGAPTVDLSRWTDWMGESRVGDVYDYYGIRPYFRVAEHAAHDAAHGIYHHLGQVERLGSITGMDVLDRENQKIGKIENVIIDLSNGRIVELTIAAGNYLGKHGERSAVPPQALHFGPDHDVLTLNTTKEALLNAPHFTAGEDDWIVTRSQATEVYQAYHVLPYFLPAGLGSSTLAASRVNTKKLQPAVQGKSQFDLDVTAKIEKEIQDTEGLSADARAVKVTTLNDRVTLRGTVDTPDEKRRLGEIAARVVPDADVENQLEVKNTTASIAY
jgi:sporulation protein YlmC with PRC-barrel domain